MNEIQKQSIIILINSIESQLSSLKALVSVGVRNDPTIDSQRQGLSTRYTTPYEDDQLGQLFEPPDQDKHDIFLQDIFKQAAEEVVGQDGTDKPE